METKKRATRSSTKVDALKATPAKASPKRASKKAKVSKEEKPPVSSGVESTPMNIDGEILVLPDKVASTSRLTEDQHVVALQQEIQIPSRPQAPINYETPLFDNDLPDKYAVLELYFNKLLSTYMFLKGRKQSCTWWLAKEPVENACSRNFELSNIAQMQTVLPGALKLEVWRHTTSKVGWDYAIEITDPTTSRPLSYSSMTQLRKSFHSNLVDIAKKNHSLFLKKKKLKSPTATLWHPQFKNDDIPDIIPFPIPPLSDSNSKSTSDSNSAPSTPNKNKEERQTSEEANLDSKATEIHSTTPPSPAAIPASLAGLSAATIAAVREDEKAEEAESEETKLLRRLPIVARALHSLCVGEKKRAFKRAILELKMVECSAAPLSVSEASESLRRIAVLVPEWATMYKLEGEEWIRFDKKQPMAKSLAILQKVSREQQ